MHTRALGVLLMLLLMVPAQWARGEAKPDPGYRRWIGLAAGLAGGFYAGSLIGDRVNPDASADDINNIIIGAGIGAAAAGAAGYYLGRSLDREAQRTAAGETRAALEDDRLTADVIARVAAETDPLRR